MLADLIALLKNIYFHLWQIDTKNICSTNIKEQIGKHVNTVGISPKSKHIVIYFIKDL